jgi:hypothetical protein
MTKVYIYKLTTDDGGAPCVYDRVWSLAICKPAIRKTAKKNNIILGFAGNHLYENNCLIYIARVTQRLTGKKYFRDKNAFRPDCIYKWDGRHFSRRRHAKFHSSPADLAHDLGTEPDYSRANVLLSEGTKNFRYFGDRCPVEYKHKYPKLTKLINKLEQGHRVNFNSKLKNELRQFIKELWRARFRHREPAIKDVSCRDSCSSADEKHVVGEC